jgi:hypothetical protein
MLKTYVSAFDPTERAKLFHEGGKEGLHKRVVWLCGR